MHPPFTTPDIGPSTLVLVSEVNFEHAKRYESYGLVIRRGTVLRRPERLDCEVRRKSFWTLPYIFKFIRKGRNTVDRAKSYLEVTVSLTFFSKSWKEMVQSG